MVCQSRTLAIFLSNIIINLIYTLKYIHRWLFLIYNFRELTEAFRYSNHLIQGTCGSPVEPDDISILICQDILENMTYFDLISKIKHAGIGISDAALLDNGYWTLGLLLLLKPFLQIDFHWGVFQSTVACCFEKRRAANIFDLNENLI